MADQPIDIELTGRQNPARELADAFANAERTICAAVYKFDEPEIFNALKSVIEREREGEEQVEVRLVVDWRQIEKKKYKFTRKLMELDGNVTVRKWPGDKLHAKFVIVDDGPVLTGSYNWSKGAKEKNTELLLRFDDRKSVRRFNALFEQLWKNGIKP